MPRPEFEPSVFAPLGQRAVDLMGSVLTLLRGGFTLRDNAKYQTFAVTFAAADTAQDIDISALKLPTPPTGYLVIKINGTGTVASTAGDEALWSATNIRLRCSATRTATIWVV